MGNQIDEILKARGHSNGDYVDMSRAIQRLKFIIRNEVALREERQQECLNSIQLEALDMIAHKIGRIIAGDPNHQDHWRDIAGYATLVADNQRENN